MKTLQGHIAAFFTILVWGITFISTKILLADLQAQEILFIRFFLGWLALLLISPGIPPFKDLKIEIMFCGAGFFGVTLYFLLENIALKYTLASNVGVLVSTAPFFTALVTWLFGNGQKPGAHFYAGFILAMAGITMISFADANISISPIGDILALLAAVAWAFYSVISRKLADLKLGALKTTRRSFFYGLILMLPILAIMGFDCSLATILKPVNLGNMIFLGLGASAICFATWTFSLARLGTTKASAYIYLAPVITVVCASIWLKESLGWMSLWGMAMVIPGLILSEMSSKLHLPRKITPKSPLADHKV